MLLSRLGYAAVAAAAAVLLPSATAQSSDSPSSTFVNADGAIGFAFAVPKDAEDQFYFTLRVHRSHAWGAVGLGAEDMPGALYLMVYDNRDQTNTTFSPRLGYGYYEPYHHTDFEYEILEGTGIYDDHMVVMGRCLRNCMTWPAKGTKGGKIDAKSTREKGIYALGPLEGFTSDDKDESLKFHVQYGSFYMDMSRAHGATEPPTLSDRSRSDGAKLDQKYVRKADVMSTMHAVAMILGIVLLMPLGVVMLRLGWWVRWHALNQTIAMVMVLMGFGVGIATSLRYQRSRNFDSYHQILGFFIIIFILVQFSLGFLHHRQFRQTQLPTRFGKIHLWFGRFIILLGIMNGFFGFTFALNRRYGLILAGLVIAMCFAILITIVGRRWLGWHRRNTRIRSGHGSPHNRPPVDEHGPWPGHGPNEGRRQQFVGHPDSYDEPPPQYSPPQQQQQNIGLRQVVAGLRRGDPQRPQQQRWGSDQRAPQTPREML